MRKQFLNKLIAIALSSVLCIGMVGCASSGNGTQQAVGAGDGNGVLSAVGNGAAAGGETDNGVVSLTIWAELANYDLLNQMIESFKAKYAGQAVFEFEILESADASTKDNILADVHSAPDIFFFADDQLPMLAASGVLSEVPNAGEVRTVNTEGSVAAASIGDMLFAYPMSADNGFFLYYNKNYFSETDVQSLDRILEIAEENGKKFSMEWDSGWYLYAFFGNTGLEFGINEDGVTNYCNWNTTEGAIKGVDIVRAMLDISASPGFLNIPDSEFIANIQDGTVIAGVSGVWNAMEVQAAWGDYGAVKLPTFTCAGRQIQMSSFVGYKMVGVNAYSEHLTWAHRFADWITNEENQVLRFEVRNQGPSNINAAASDEVGQIPAIRAVVEQSEYGVLQRVGNNYWTPFTTFGETLAAGNPDGTPLQELIDTLVAGITASTIN